MTIVAVVTDDEAGHAAFGAAVAEGMRRHAEVVAVNLGGGPLAAASSEVKVSVVDRTTGVEDGDMVLEVLAREAGVELVVVGVRRRSPLGKALLGDLAQRLLLEVDLPVLAVKPPV